ncbi:MAG: sigma-70 family RNA polymerase sigma factor [Desulfovibrionaceae bacterium]|nr:sigma-70 family RNA polymerase sigma factor [Desulfovibrionaceae bacterium]
MTGKVVVTATDPRAKALIEICLARHSDLRAIASKIVGHPDMAEDVLQDAYLKLVKWGYARDLTNPFGYCCQAVRNMALDYCRRRMVEAGCFINSANGDLPEVDGGARADAGINERRSLACIETVLGALPSRTRLVFELSRLEGKTQREIAKIIGVSATLVNFMVKDAMMALAVCRDILRG